MISPTLALRAAALLEREAQTIEESHCLNGGWDGEEEARADYDEMMATAAELRRNA